jgi:phosphatidate cytidylyltransferase
MARVLSAVVILPVVFGTLWYLPPIATLVIAELVVAIGFAEYASLAERLGMRLPRFAAGTAAVALCAAFYVGPSVVAIVLLAAPVALGLVALAGPRRTEMLADLSAALFGMLYLGVPLGALVAVRWEDGRAPALLLLAAIMVSDTVQYYGGRSFGRTPLAPSISPKKTVEGAVCGFVGGIVVMSLGGVWVLPRVGIAAGALMGAALVGIGIAGDLFESQLKRAAGLKDASRLIPGHGGMLDRIDALLFAAPVYYLFLRLVA